MHIEVPWITLVFTSVVRSSLYMVRELIEKKKHLMPTVKYGGGSVIMLDVSELFGPIPGS